MEMVATSGGLSGSERGMMARGGGEGGEREPTAEQCASAGVAKSARSAEVEGEYGGEGAGSGARSHACRGEVFRRRFGSGRRPPEREHDPIFAED